MTDHDASVLLAMQNQLEKARDEEQIAQQNYLDAMDRRINIQNKIVLFNLRAAK